MKLLLDTHIALWVAVDQRLLAPGELNLLLASDSELFFSSVAIWELRLKWNSFHASGERKGPASPAQVLATLTDAGIEQLTLTADHAAAELSSPLPHKDPFDELLLAQAQEEEMKFLTRDRNLVGHPLVLTG